MEIYPSSVLIKGDEARAQRYRVDARLHELNFSPETVGHRYVVCIHASDQFGAGLFDPSIQAGAYALVRLREGSDPRIGESPDHLLAFVRGAVIHDDELEVMERLAQDTLDGSLQEPFSVVDGHHHRYDWVLRSRWFHRDDGSSP